MALQFTGNRNAKMSSVVAIDWDNVVNKPGLVRYDIDQALTDAQEEQARENIDAAKRHWIDVTEATYGAIGDGVTDCTAAFALASQANTTMFIPAGTYIVDSFDILDGMEIIGAGQEITIIKKKANSAVDYLFKANGVSGFTVRNLTLDGNKANQTAGSNVITLLGHGDYEIESVTVKNAKANAGFGGGIVSLFSTNAANVTRGRVAKCKAIDNDGKGISFRRDFYLTIDGNFCTGNGSDGISFEDSSVPVVEGIAQFVSIINNQCHDNGRSGIDTTGFFTSAGDLGPGDPPNKHFVITGNHCARNVIYGLKWQGGNGYIAGNIIEKNEFGGLLANAENTVLDGNIISDNTDWGIDCGAALSISVVNNHFHNNGLTANQSTIDLNIGGTLYCHCAGNVFNSSGTHTVSHIKLIGTEATSQTNPIDQYGQYILIEGNVINANGSAGSVGIIVHDGYERAIVKNNLVVGAAAGRSFFFECPTVIQFGNVSSEVFDNSTTVQYLTAASTLVIPDFGETFYVNGSFASIANIRTSSFNSFIDKVRDVVVTNKGSGYSQGTPPTVSFSGGGGSGAAGFAQVDIAGEVVDVVMTNYGSGYVTAPSVSFVGGGGSGATGTARIGCNNFDGREITLHFGTSQALATGGNLGVTQSAVIPANGIVKLKGMFGSWWIVGHSQISALSAVAEFSNTGLKIRDSDQSNTLGIVPNSNLTANRTLTLATGDADRTITLSGNPTLSDWFDQSVKTTANPTFGNVTATKYIMGAQDVLELSSGYVSLNGPTGFQALNIGNASIGDATTYYVNGGHSFRAADGTTVLGLLNSTAFASNVPVIANNDDAVPAGGSNVIGFKATSTANLGVFFGSGAPTLSAAQGSLYVRTDGSTTATRLYVNTNGTTGWTNVVTAA